MENIDKMNSFQNASLSFREYSWLYKLTEDEWLQGYMLYKRGQRRGNNVRMLGVALIAANFEASPDVYNAILKAKKQIEDDLGVDFEQIDEAYPIRSLR